MDSTIFDLSFWQQFSANFLATIIGVVIGIPAGFYLNKWIERTTLKEKKGKILNLLRGELDYNQAIISDWYFPPGETVPDDKDNSELSLFLRDDVWRAFADGGELQWIKEPELLEDLSIAYFQIGVMKKLSERFFELTSKSKLMGSPHVVSGITSEMHKGADEFLKWMKNLNKDFEKYLK